MKFDDPGWLAAGLLACLALVWMWRRHDARQKSALARFVAPHLRRALTRSLSVAGRRAQRGLFLGAVALLCAALAGPLVGYRWEQISRRGHEIVFAIDTSRSMSTPDVRPNRLARAKLAIDDFTTLLDGDAVGIVAFAGTAFLVCPITLDYGAFHESLGAIDTHTIPRGGTNISLAIEAAQAALRRRPGSDKILILVTDGEDLEGNALTAARAAAQSDGLKIYTVGVGTAAGELIPIPPDQGGGFVKDEQGAFVTSRLDEAALEAIAGATGGVYAPLGAQGEGLEFIFKTIFGSVAKHDLAFRQRKVYIQRYQWPLAGSLGMLLASLLIGTRRRRGVPVSASVRTALRTSLTTSLMGLTLAALRPAHSAEASDPSGAKPRPKQPVVEFNTGTLAYRAGQFPQAAQAFQQSISHAPSSDSKRLNDQEDAYYNLGNALYRAGQKTEKEAPQDTLKTWTSAVKAYETALQLRPDDADSRFNRDLVKRKIDALQQNQNQNQNRGPGGSQGQPPPPPGGSKGDRPPPGAAGQPPPPSPGQPPPPSSGQPPPPSSGQPPPPSSGQPPPPGAAGQPPPPSPGQPPPPSSGQPPPPSPGQPPPPSSGQPPPPSSGGPPPPRSSGEPPRSDPSGGSPDQRANGAADAAEEPRVPGQMSREEARELLDSVKGDERHALGAPLTPRAADQPPDKPYKNW